MHRYLANLHKKSDRHKKHFAFLVSGTVTLLILGVWSLATFGVNGGVMAETKNDEVSPFQSWRASLASGFESLRGDFGALESSLKAVDFEAKYREMKDGALKVYGQ